MAKFNIIKEYLKKVEFTSPNTPALFFNNKENCTRLSINIDTRCAASADGLYDVAVSAVITPVTPAMEVFHLEMEFHAIVTLKLLPDTPDEEKQKVLMVDVPDIIYPFVRNMASQITLLSGFPAVELPYFDFEENFKAKLRNGDVHFAENKTSAPADKDVFSYESVVGEFSDTKEGAEFLNTCVEQGMDPFSMFDDTPMYKYIMRFIDVPEFNHPEIKERATSYSVFEQLFQMLAMNEKATYRFAHEDGLELYVAYGVFDDKPLSQFNLAELDALMTSLIIDSWVNLNVPLTYLFSKEAQSKADEYMDDLDIQNMITYDEFAELFRDYADSLYLDMQKVMAWHRTLEEIDMATLPYRFQFQ